MFSRACIEPMGFISHGVLCVNVNLMTFYLECAKYSHFLTKSTNSEITHVSLYLTLISMPMYKQFTLNYLRTKFYLV